MGLGDSNPATLGFLTVLEHEQQGLVGGYLILNSAGRPLEFHCTVPVKPNRAQQILFGPTLQSYLYGEQIGQTLVAKGAVEPLAVCTDVEQVLSVRDFVSLPVALVLKEEQRPTGDLHSGESPAWRADASHHLGTNLQTFQVGRNRLAVKPDREADRSVIA